MWHANGTTGEARPKASAKGGLVLLVMVGLIGRRMWSRHAMTRPGSQAKIGEARMICRPWTAAVPVELPL